MRKLGDLRLASLSFSTNKWFLFELKSIYDFILILSFGTRENYIEVLAYSHIVDREIERIKDSFQRQGSGHK